MTRRPQTVRNRRRSRPRAQARRDFSERDECGEHRQDAGDQRDGEGAVPTEVNARAAARPRASASRPCCARPRSRRGERGGEQQQAGREQADRDARRKAALHPEGERDREQWDEREEVALLEALGVGVRDLGRLSISATARSTSSARTRARRGCASATARGRARQGAWDDHPAAGIHQQHRLAADPVQERARMDAVVPIGVDAEDALGPRVAKRSAGGTTSRQSESQSRRIDLKTWKRSTTSRRTPRAARRRTGRGRRRRAR